MATVVDRYGMEPVRTVIHRILVDETPFRTATHDLELSNVDGVRIGTKAGPRTLLCKLCAVAETVMGLCAELAHNMSASDDPRRVHFQSPEYLVDRLDAIAELFDKDRTDLLVEAIREYIEETADSETFQELVATKYYDNQLEFETVKQLVGAETAQRLRLLKADLEDEPLDLAAPDDVDIYDGDATAVETAADDGR